MPSTEKANKGPYSQGCGFPLGHVWCESWTIVVVQAFSCVELFATPWTAACQASLSQSLFKLISMSQ